MESNDALYKLVIVGGGPAGTGVLIRAARLGYLPRLLDPTHNGKAEDIARSRRLDLKQHGVLVLHNGDESSFGSGNLGEYINNSNTFAKSVTSSVLDERPDLDPAESIKNTFLEQVREHESAKKLDDIGAATASLKDFGDFLRHVGQCTLSEIQKYSPTSQCLLHTRAIGYQVLNDGTIQVETEKVNGSGRRMSYRAEHLVLATGGVQEKPTLDNPLHSAKLFMSDWCLRDEGMQQLQEHLRKRNGSRVCIVGGSHSSFSIANILLGIQKPKLDAVATPRKALKLAPITSNNTDDKTGTESSKTQTASLDSCTKTSKEITFKPRDITLLHRSPIRLFYLTRKDAEADGADGSRTDRSGCVNTFTGLRADSKRLYQAIRSGKEQRVRLFQINPQGCPNLMLRAYESADAIIWSCGYKSNMIPATNSSGKRIRFIQEHGVVQLDLQGRLQIMKGGKAEGVKNIFGIGLGFSLRSSVDEMGSPTRADGVTVYHRRGASLVLASIFGTTVFGSSCSTFEEMVEKVDQKRQETKALKVEASAKIKPPSPIKPSNPSTKLSRKSSPAKDSIKLLSHPQSPMNSSQIHPSDSCARNPPVKLARLHQDVDSTVLPELTRPSPTLKTTGTVM